jgi:hypothetical protein
MLTTMRIGYVQTDGAPVWKAGTDGKESTPSHAKNGRHPGLITFSIATHNRQVAAAV